MRNIIKENYAPGAASGEITIGGQTYICYHSYDLFNTFIADIISGEETGSTAYGQTFENIVAAAYPYYQFKGLNQAGNMPFADLLSQKDEGLYSVKFSRRVGLDVISGMKYSQIHKALANIKTNIAAGQTHPLALVKGSFDYKAYPKVLNLGALPVKVDIVAPTRVATPRYGFDRSGKLFMTAGGSINKTPFRELAEKVFGADGFELSNAGRTATQKKPKISGASSSEITNTSTFIKKVMLDGISKAKSADKWLIITPYDSHEEFKNAYDKQLTPDKYEIPRSIVKSLFSMAVDAQTTEKASSERIGGALLAFNQLVNDQSEQKSLTAKSFPPDGCYVKIVGSTKTVHNGTFGGGQIYQTSTDYKKAVNAIAIAFREKLELAVTKLPKTLPTLRPGPTSNTDRDLFFTIRGIYYNNVARLMAISTVSDGVNKRQITALKNELIDMYDTLETLSKLVFQPDSNFATDQDIFTHLVTTRVTEAKLKKLRGIISNLLKEIDIPQKLDIDFDEIIYPQSDQADAETIVIDDETVENLLDDEAKDEEIESQTNDDYLADILDIFKYLAMIDDLLKSIALANPLFAENIIQSYQADSIVSDVSVNDLMEYANLLENLLYITARKQ